MNKEQYLDVRGAAQHLQVKESWIYAHRDELPTIKIGALLRFRLADLDAWMLSNLELPSWR